MRLLLRKSELDNDHNDPGGLNSDYSGHDSDNSAGSSDGISSSHHGLTSDQIIIIVFVTMCLLALVVGVMVCICCCHANRSIKAAQGNTRRKKQFPTSTLRALLKFKRPQRKKDQQGYVEMDEWEDHPALTGDMDGDPGTWAKQDRRYIGRGDEVDHAVAKETR